MQLFMSRKLSALDRLLNSYRKYPRSDQLKTMFIQIVVHLSFKLSWKKTLYIIYTNIDQTLVNSLHGLLNCEKGGLGCHVITTE